MILGSIVIHLSILLIGYWSTGNCIRRVLDVEFVEKESIEKLAANDGARIFGVIVCVFAMLSAAVVYWVIAIALSDADNAANALLAGIAPFIYPIYGCVVLPLYIMLVESRSARQLRLMKYVSALSSIAFAVVVWVVKLQYVAWFPGA